MTQAELGSATQLSLTAIDINKFDDVAHDYHSSVIMIMPLAVERIVVFRSRLVIGQPDEYEFIEQSYCGMGTTR